MLHFQLAIARFSRVRHTSLSARYCSVLEGTTCFTFSSLLLGSRGYDRLHFQPGPGRFHLQWFRLRFRFQHTFSIPIPTPTPVILVTIPTPIPTPTLFLWTIPIPIQIPIPTPALPIFWLWLQNYISSDLNTSPGVYTMCKLFEHYKPYPKQEFKKKFCLVSAILWISEHLHINAGQTVVFGLFVFYSIKTGLYLFIV